MLALSVVFAETDKSLRRLSQNARSSMKLYRSD
jgi:hypothetical protein